VELIARFMEFGAAGAAGGLAHELLAYKGLKLWEYDRECRILRVGFLGSIFLGILAAMLIDGHVVTAICAGIAGPHVCETAAARLMGALDARARRNGGRDNGGH
jgi:hypothetical protein